MPSCLDMLLVSDAVYPQTVLADISRHGRE